MPKLKKATVMDELEIEGLGLVRSGVKVVHPVLGEGVIEELYLWADGKTKTLRVLFEKHGSKALAPEYARLKLAQ